MKKTVSVFVLVLLVLSLFTVAQSDVEEKSSCSGFFGSLSCFFWGHPENRAGRGWFEGRNVVGKATAETDAPARGVGFKRLGEVPEGRATYFVFDGGIWRLYDSDGQRIVLPERVTQEQVNTQVMNLWTQRENLPNGYEYNSYHERFLDEEARIGGVAIEEDIQSPGTETPLEQILPPTFIEGETTFTQAQERIQYEGREYGIYNDLAGNKGYAFINNQWVRVGVEDGRTGFVTGEGRITQDITKAEISGVLTLNTFSRVFAPGIIKTFEVNPSFLSDGPLSEGDTIVSTTGAEFRVENGEWTQTRGPRENPSERLATDDATKQAEKIDLLNNPNNYGSGKRFPRIIPSPQRVAEAQRTLGETVYNQVKNEIDWFTSRGTDYRLTNPLRTLSVTEQNGVTTVDLQVKQADGRAINNDLSQIVIVTGDQEMLTQTYAQRDKGMVTLSGSTGEVYVEPNVDITAGSFSYYANEQAFKDKKPQGEHTIKNGIITNTNYEQRTRVIRNTGTGTLEEQNGDTYNKGEGGCKEALGCFVPTDGTLVDAQGNRYSTDIDHEGSGASRKVTQTRLYNQQTGRLEGFKTKEGTVVHADKNEDGKYNGKFTFQRTGGVTFKAEKKNGVWQCGAGASDGACTKDQIKIIEDIQSHTTGGFAIAQTVLSSIYSISQSVKDYPALTRLFGLPNWQTEMDKQFAPLLGSNWFPSTICGSSYDIEPEGFATIRTPYGLDQAVAGIQMERSATTSPILCQRNPDTAAEEQFICDQGQVCINDGFCYLDEDEDGEADEDTPAQGYFYKISWGVSAPRDEASTPLLDENGVAVSFNIWLDKNPDGVVQTDAPNGIYLYSRQGDFASPIELKNGDNDHEVIIHYSPNLYEEACIKWDQAPSTTGSGFSGTHRLDDVCFTVDVSSVGEVNWQRAGQTAPSVTTQSAEVQRNNRW